MSLACLIHFAESIATKSVKENDPFFFKHGWSFFLKHISQVMIHTVTQKKMEFSSVAHLNEW